MRIIDRGTGAPIVLIPGIQGRWEWMAPAVAALSARCRVITFSLADEPTCGGTFDEQTGFWCYVEQVREAMDTAGVERATVCGVSYGGLIAAAFAARYPDRVASLALVSAVPPSWRPNARVRFYLRAPRLLSPVFILGSLRMYPEVAAASGGIVAGIVPAARHLWRVLTHMFSPGRMSRRVHLLHRVNPVEAARAIADTRIPTLVVTGESGLDKVVEPEATRKYAALWPHARVITLERTGHLGLITRPEAFADLLVPFISANQESRITNQESRRQVG